MKIIQDFITEIKITKSIEVTAPNKDFRFFTRKIIISGRDETLTIIVNSADEKILNLSEVMEDILKTNKPLKTEKTKK